MHASTRQLFRSQSVQCQPKGSNALELVLNEKGSAKLCREVATLSRADRARLMALIQEGFRAVREGQDPEAIAALIRSEVKFNVR